MDSDARREIANVRDWYDRTAGTFDARYSGVSADFWRLFEEEVAVEQLGGHLGHVLDLGCGAGRLADSLSPLSDSVLGVDVSLAMLAIARSRRHRPNVRYAAMDAANSGVAPESFDTVISLGMFEYLDDPSPFLREILRVLRPGGTLVFTCHNRPPFMMRAFIYGEAKLLGLLRSARARHGAPRVARHTPARMFALLHELGFVATALRGFHFGPAVDAFHLAARLPARLRAKGMMAAAKADRLIGGARPTRILSSLSMYSARKPA